MQAIHWTPEMVGRFIKAVQAAKESSAFDFTFDGHLFVVAYAEHLIDYLTDCLAMQRPLQ